MVRSFSSCLSPALLATLALSVSPAASAGERIAAPIEYVSFNSAQPQGQGTRQNTHRSIPQPNSSATRDAWRGPVTRTGSGSLPQTRETISFAYPGASNSKSAAASSQQFASLESRPRASEPASAAKIWPVRANAPASGSTDLSVSKSLTLGAETATPVNQPSGMTFEPSAVGVPHEERGVASWYGKRFDGRPTANGETFDMNAMTAAHRTLPLPSLVQVVNEDNGKEVVVRVNDRGPFADDRVIDLSRRAAKALDIIDDGTAPVALRYLGPAPDVPAEPIELASADAAVTAENLPELEVVSPLSRPNLYGNMLADGLEPSLGIPDPGKSIATPARIETLSASAAKYTSDTLAGGPADTTSTEMASSEPEAIEPAPAPRIEPAARTIYAAASPSAAADPSPSTAESFGPQIFIQVGAFGDIGNAHNMHARVGSGFPVKVEDARVDGSEFFRVLVGPYPTRDAAERAKSELGTQGVTNGFVTLR